ncbi:MAG TPA: ABC transporter permease [Gaiellaceae bacterium]|nr:ABC transporter permease [Gaiellaceae bacterium]
MSFVSLVLRNLFRQRMRTALTVVGISVGITIVVALGAITGGLKDTAGAMLREGGADFMVARKGSADLTFSAVSAKEWTQVASMQGVERATGVLMHVTRHGSNPFFPLLGIRAAQLEQSPPELVAGRLLAPGATDEVILGTSAAADTDSAPGSSVTIAGKPFRVVGIYRSDNVFYDSGGYAPLEAVQDIARKPDVVTAVYVTAQAGAEPRALAVAIEDAYPELTTVRDVTEYGKVDQGIQIMDALNLAVSVLAIALGAIAVMNTMIMAVFERTREFGILRAVGWRGSRIMRLVLTEALLLCLVAAVLGTAFGVLATRGVMLIEEIRNFLEPTYTLDVFVRAVLIAAGVGLVGALYPAYRAVRLSPMEALRHE